MRLFSHLHKSSFWSQFVLGIVAIFALPNMQTAHVENEINTVVNQSIGQIEQEFTQLYEIEQSHFLVNSQEFPLLNTQQAGLFYKISTKIDRLLIAIQPPIRAGPSLI